MKRIIGIILAIILLIPSVLLGQSLDMEFIEDIEEIIKSQYYNEVNKEELSINAVKGMLENLDPNSNYYTIDEAEDFLQVTSGELAGIGIVMTHENGNIKVKEFVENSPAKKVGLKLNDTIKFVNDKYVNGMDIREISNNIRGPVGELVILKIKRKDIPYLIEVPIIREKIKINPVKMELINNIAHISINEFSKGTGDYLMGEILKLRAKNINKIILDLRANPGGLFIEAQKVADLLFPKGELVKVKERDKTYTVNGGKSKIKYELIVLIDGGSASASEIITGAVKDRGLGKIVGTKSYGKSTIQNIIPYKDKGIVTITIGEYLTPNGHSINGKGIMPDIVVEEIQDKDAPLEKAIELLK